MSPTEVAATRPRVGRRARVRAPWPLARRRPGLVEFVLERLREMYGVPEWQPRRDGTSELVLTILSQNTSDRNAERAFEELRRHFPTWEAVEAADPFALANAIRVGGLAQQKAPRIRAALRAVREARGDYHLDFLGGMPPLEARAWLTRIPGVGPKTASVVLLFCYGLPLMPIDTHVERVSRRIGLLDPHESVVKAHDTALAIFPRDRLYEAHVNLITHGRRTCHARRPECERCLIAARCRFVDPRAP